MIPAGFPLVGEIMPELDLPPGYRLDETTDPGATFLRRPDGTEVAIFSARGASREAIEEAAWRDYRGRE